MAHWNRVAAQKNDPQRAGAFYQQLLEHYYCMMVQSGLRVLELGCGGGDLLAALKPSFGVGVDFSAEMLDIARANLGQLRKAGLASGNMFDCGVCTSCRVEAFFSHRADGGVTGRQITGVVVAK